MQVAVEAVSGLEHRLKISVPAERINKEIENRIQKLTRTAKIDGFRQGKIPKQVIQQRFGFAVQVEVIDEIVRKSLQEALQQEKLQPAGSPEVKFISDKYDPAKPFDYEAIFEIFPIIELKPFSELSIEKIVTEIKPEDIDTTLEGMRKQQVEWNIVDRPSENGDRVWIKFEGKIDGQPFQGGSADNMSVILGSRSTIAGFEEGMINAKTGQELTLNLQFPENYQAKELAGKPVIFDIKINKIEAPKLPEIDDAFAARFGITEGGVAKLREEVQQTLQQQLNRVLRNKLKSEVMDKLKVVYNDISIPKTLVNAEAKRLMQQTEEQFKQYKMPSVPEFKLDMFIDRAKERVSLGLVINEITHRFAIKAEASRVRELIEQMAESYDNPQQVIAWYYSQKDRLVDMEYVAVEDQIVEKIMSEAKVVEKPATLAEVLNLEGAARG